MPTAQQLQTGYGLTSALPFLANPPIVAKRAPTTADKAQIGTLWINVPANAVFTLTSVVNNAATWTANGGGGAGVFASVEATTGNITADLGNIVATVGNITAGGNFSTTNGNFNTTNGNITTANGDVTADSIVIRGDTGAPVANNIQLSNVTDTTQGAGALTILSTTANPGNNTGFFKIYVGVATCWVPYFADIAP